MEYLYIALILLAAFVPAAIIVLKTNQAKKRGCGRGCATCGNRDSCHRGEESLKKNKRTESDEVQAPQTPVAQSASPKKDASA